jgi:hypothetical protein
VDYLPDFLRQAEKSERFEILVQILHFFQLVLKNPSFGHPLNGNLQEFIFFLEC